MQKHVCFVLMCAFYAGVMTLWKKVRLREVVYTLSPFEHDVMSTYFKDIPYKTSKLWNLWGFDLMVYCAVPYYATVSYAEYVVDQEEKATRF